MGRITMNRNTTIQNTPTRKTTITGKHREYLIELLLYHIGQQSDDDDTIQEYYASISASVKRRDAFGKYWIEHYIDNYNNRIAICEQTYKQIK